MAAIYVQKISIPSEEWSLDVESSDTIEGVKSKVADQELPIVYDPSKINLFFDGTELQDGQTISYYGIQKNNHLTSSYDSSNCDPRFDKFAKGNENGCERFRRLWLLGYV